MHPTDLRTRMHIRSPGGSSCHGRPTVRVNRVWATTSLCGYLANLEQKQVVALPADHVNHSDRPGRQGLVETCPTRPALRRRDRRHALAGWAVQDLLGLSVSLEVRVNPEEKVRPLLAGDAYHVDVSSTRPCGWARCQDEALGPHRDHGTDGRLRRVRRHGVRRVRRSHLLCRRVLETVGRSRLLRRRAVRGFVIAPGTPVRQSDGGEQSRGG